MITPPPPPKIYTCRLHTISCLFSHMCTVVISAETIVNIGVFRCCPRMHTTLLLSILFRDIDKSAAEFRSTNIRLYVFGKQNLSEGTRVICCGTQKTSCFFAFFGPEKTVTVHHGHCVFHSAIEGCARTCSHVALLHLPKSAVAPPDFPCLNRCL